MAVNDSAPNESVKTGHFFNPLHNSMSRFLEMVSEREDEEKEGAAVTGFQ